MPPPPAKMMMATTKLQKYSSLPWPKGWFVSAGLAPRRIPYSSSTPLPVSTTEWMPSLIIAELPVKAAATNLVAAMARLPTMAATTAFFDDGSATVVLHDRFVSVYPGRRRSFPLLAAS